MNSVIDFEITPLKEGYNQRWGSLVREYKTFYETKIDERELRHAWQRLVASNDVFGIGLLVDGELVAFAHYFFHTTVWEANVCYLQDLFVEERWRGQGFARALIEWTAAEAKARGASKYYWMTHDNNQPARSLYDKIAEFAGFIRYDYPVGKIKD